MNTFHLTATGSPTAEKVTPAKMDAALKAKWVEALRGAEFKQTRGTLRDGEGYCCLGVLCKVAGLTIVSDGSGVFMGPGVPAWQAYQPIFDLVGGVEISHALSMRNDGLLEDGRKWPFSEIADYIEENL